MIKPSVREYGVFVGNLLVFVSIFLPWYSINMNGATVIHSGVHLASTSPIFGMLYFLPLLSGVLACGVVLSWCNRRVDVPEKTARIIVIVLSAIILLLIFAVLAMPIVGTETLLLNVLYLGGYVAITGALLSLLVTLLPAPEFTR